MLRGRDGPVFTDDEVTEFLRRYVEKYPDTIERMHFITRHPYDDTSRLYARCRHELEEIAEQCDFYHTYAQKLLDGNILALFKISAEYAKQLESHGIDKKTLAYQKSFNNLSRDVVRKSVSMLESDDDFDDEE